MYEIISVASSSSAQIVPENKNMEHELDLLHRRPTQLKIKKNCLEKKRGQIGRRFETWQFILYMFGKFVCGFY